jgi:hypothetical protein
MPCYRRGRSIAALLRCVAAGMLCLQLAGCAHYEGPVTNAPDENDLNGPPLLNNYYAP